MRRKPYPGLPARARCTSRRAEPDRPVTRVIVTLPIQLIEALTIEADNAGRGRSAEIARRLEQGFISISGEFVMPSRRGEPRW